MIILYMEYDIEKFCELAGITEEQFYGKVEIGGSLNLSSLESIPEGFNPTVGGSLDLRSLKSIPEGFNPTVGGSLYLDSLKSIPEGFNPTVGGSLDLDSLKSIPEGFNPTANCLYINDEYVSEDEFNKIPENYLFSWQGGKYIKVDGNFSEVVSHKGNVYHVKELNKDKVFYLVTDGEGRYAHGDTLDEAKVDLIFKVSNRTKDDYKDLTLTDILSVQDAITCYRVITGSCSFGTKDFVNNRLKVNKESYTIQEIIDLTGNEYKNKEFKQFFTL